MKKLPYGILVLGLVAAAFVVPTSWAAPHFGLRSSSPEADATVSEVSEIRLWFSQVPREGSALIRLVDPAGDAVETGELRSDPGDGSILFVSVPGTLTDGAYTVLWRGIGDDGHVVRGDFGFVVATER
jgi:methionine-rich copper-binding protein CopC